MDSGGNTPAARPSPPGGATEPEIKPASPLLVEADKPPALATFHAQKGRKKNEPGPFAEELKEQNAASKAEKRREEDAFATKTSPSLLRSAAGMAVQFSKAPGTVPRVASFVKNTETGKQVPTAKVARSNTVINSLLKNARSTAITGSALDERGQRETERLGRIIEVTLAREQAREKKRKERRVLKPAISMGDLEAEAAEAIKAAARSNSDTDSDDAFDINGVRLHRFTRSATSALTQKDRDALRKRRKDKQERRALRRESVGPAVRAAWAARSEGFQKFSEAAAVVPTLMLKGLLHQGFGVEESDSDADGEMGPHEERPEYEDPGYPARIKAARALPEWDYLSYDVKCELVCGPRRASEVRDREPMLPEDWLQYARNLGTILLGYFVVPTVVMLMYVAAAQSKYQTPTILLRSFHETLRYLYNFVIWWTVYGL